MKAVIVEDEEFILKEMEKLIAECNEIDEEKAFMKCSNALDYVKKHGADIAFLDIDMRGMGGIELAKRIREINSKCYIVFCTGYEEYMADAFKIHANGFLLKPVEKEEIMGEIEHYKIWMQVPEKSEADLENPPGKKKNIQARCFGGFEVYVDGEPLLFHRKKAKELLALLIDKRGIGINLSEICTILWNNSMNDEKNKNYFWQILRELRQVLEKAGVSDVLKKNGAYYMIDEKRIESDSYVYIDKYGQDSLPDNYMINYDWADKWW